MRSARSMTLRLLAVVLGALGNAGPPASAETVNCTAITTLPFTISSPGLYCLTADIGSSGTGGAAILINADGVVLDLNGHELKGPTSFTTGMSILGIQVSPHRNVTIHNGTVRGFVEGIHVDDASGASRGHIIEDMHVERAMRIGISIEGAGILVRRNVVLDTGAQAALNAAGQPKGIRVTGDDVRVVDNDVAHFSATAGKTASVIAITGDQNLAIGNRIAAAAPCGLSLSGSSNKYRDNLVDVAATHYCGGTDIGNNH
jgi:hypothetical protein